MTVSIGALDMALLLANFVTLGIAFILLGLSLSYQMEGNELNSVTFKYECQGRRVREIIFGNKMKCLLSRSSVFFFFFSR